MQARTSFTWSISMALEELLSAQNITKTFRDGPIVSEVLRGVSLELRGGEFVALVGPSGCGKSTLLNILGLADRPTSGVMSLAGEQLRGAPEAKLRVLRRSKLGYVFQHFNILSTLSARENVMVPLLLNGVSAHDAEMRADAVLERVGLAHRRTAMPFSLSGGELQRVAIARAVAHRPAVVLADEPTGNLDSTAGEKVLELLEAMVHEGIAVLMATHSEAAMARCTRTVRMKDGAMV
jgi:putative ABC transport system ATP-binding protein